MCYIDIGLPKFFPPQEAAMKRLLVFMVAAALLMSVAVPLFAKEKSSNNSGYCVATGNGRAQALGGKSGSHTSTRKGLSNAFQHSQSIKRGEKQIVTK
jgi:hypothetical protein